MAARSAKLVQLLVWTAEMAEFARAQGCTCEPLIDWEDYPRPGDAVRCTVAHDDDCPVDMGSGLFAAELSEPVFT